MSDKGGAAGRGGSGLLTAGIVLAAVIVAGTYLGMRDSGSPTQDELSALVAPGSPQTPEADVPETEALQGSPATDIAEQNRAVPDGTKGAEGVSDGAAPDPAETADAGTAADTSAAKESGATDPVLPRIDEVRVDGDGILIVAGRAAPGSQVRVLIDGVETATALADRRGAFAAVALIGPSDALRILSLEATEDGIVTASAGEIILAPVDGPVAVAGVGPEADLPDAIASGSAADGTAPPPGETGDAVALTQSATAAPSQEGGVATSDPATSDTRMAGTGQGTSESVAEAATPGDSAPDQSAGAGVSEQTVDADTRAPAAAPGDAVAGAGAQDPAAPAPALAAEAPGALQAPPALPLPDTGTSQPLAVLRSDAGGVTLLDTAPTPPDSIQLDTIGYSAEGVVQLSGRAGTDAREVRIYLDNRAVLSLPMDAAGGWRGEVPDVDAGVYTLRVDAVGADGQVTSRVETPFKREAPGVLASAAAGQNGSVRAITVQTGDTLWAIARDRYGEGLLYVRVFEANRSSIRDPDLIYPGQVFDLPAEN